MLLVCQRVIQWPERTDAEEIQKSQQSKDTISVNKLTRRGPQTTKRVFFDLQQMRVAETCWYNSNMVRIQPQWEALQREAALDLQHSGVAKCPI